MPLALNQLSLDVLINIAGHLDVPDVLNLRLTSRQLREATYARAVWEAVYRSTSIPRPVGPYPSQTRQALERILLRSRAVHRNVFVTPKEPRSRLYDIGGDLHPAITTRWALTLSRDRTQVLCRDIANPNSGGHQPTTAFSVGDEDEFCIYGITCPDVASHRGQQLSLVLIELCKKDHLNLPLGVLMAHGDTSQPTKLVILRVIPPERSEAEVRFEEVYRDLRLAIPTSRLFASLSSSALIVQRKHHQRKGNTMAWNVHDLSSEPVTISDEEAPGNSPWYFTCKTHLISQRCLQGTLNTVIEATPLQDVFPRFAGSARPIASGTIRQSSFFGALRVLRDSVIDPITGSTEVILTGVEIPGFMSGRSYRLLVIRLSIPSDLVIGSPASMGVHVQVPLTIPIDLQVRSLTSAWNGSVRYAYALRLLEDTQRSGMTPLETMYPPSDDEETDDNDDDNSISDAPGINYALDLLPLKEYTQLGIVEIVYNEETQSASVVSNPKVSIPPDVQAVHDLRVTRLISFESEVGSGRLVYAEHGVGSHQSLPWKLGVLDFA